MVGLDLVSFFRLHSIFILGLATVTLYLPYKKYTVFFLKLDFSRLYCHLLWMPPDQHWGGIFTMFVPAFSPKVPLLLRLTQLLSTANAMRKSWLAFYSVHLMSSD
ncbi:hypothetical protein KIL84_011772 [Mauremys mutica]|uniref:Uncharacterized protein n=1 Tax=Mauremys mutica TaxID=74926 RepID=A0A9D3XFF1_9SAUR|nr:hypothetical protein KIL84_011772 [Mauremys mutica]